MERHNNWLKQAKPLTKKKIFKALLPFSILATWHTHFNLLDLIALTILGERYKLLFPSLWSLLHFPFSSLLGPNIHLVSCFQMPLACIPSLKYRTMRHNHNKTGNIIVLYIFIFIFAGKLAGKRLLGWPRRRWEDNIRMDLEEIGINAGNWVDSAQDRNYWRALVNAAFNLRVP